MRQIGGYDLSPVVDLQARLARGEAPGVDSIYTLPVTFALLLKLQQFFEEPSWRSLLILNLAVLYASLATIAVYWPRKLGLEKYYITILALALPALVTSHIWHSELSQLLALPYCVLAVGFFQDPFPKAATTRNVLLAAYAGALIYAKQNLGAPLLGLVVFFASCGAAIDRSRLRAAAAFALLNGVGVAVATCLLLFLLHTDLAALHSSRR
jgi:hypothetical protein